jgi:AraC family transcriptional regulator
MEIRAATYGPGAALGRHAHARQVIAIPLDGAFEIDVRGQRLLCRRGAAVTRAGEPHANRFGPRGARLLLVESDREIDVPALVEDARLRALAARLAGELSATDAAADLAREGLALELLALAARAAPARGAALARLDAFVDEHFLEPLRLADLAAVAGLHPSHLARTFRAARGESLAAHLRRRRVLWARERLLAGDEPVAAIALDAGFCDQGHFSRVFRRATGETPGQLRRRMRR